MKVDVTTVFFTDECRQPWIVLTSGGAVSVMPRFSVSSEYGVSKEAELVGPFCVVDSIKITAIANINL